MAKAKSKKENYFKFRRGW